MELGTAALRRRIHSSPRYRWWVLWSVLSGFFAVNFSVTAITLLLPKIRDELGTDDATVAWVLLGPLIAFGVVMPFLGKAGDLYGRRRVFLAGMAGATILTLASAFAPNIWVLIVLRVLMAAEGAATGPTSMALINTAFEPAERVRAMGWWSFVGPGAPVLGLVAGGWLDAVFSWRAVFLVQVPFCLASFVLAWLVLKEEREPGQRRLDVAGATLLGTSLVAVLFALNRGPLEGWGWGHPVVATCLVLSPLAAVGFVFVERRAVEPLIPLEFLRRRNFVAPLVAQFCGNFAYAGAFFVTSILLADVYGLSSAESSWVVLWRPLSFALVAPIVGTLATRIGERPVAVVGSLLVVASMTVLGFVGPAHGLAPVVLAMVGAGVGLGAVTPAASATVANSVPDEHLGVAGAAQQLFLQLGFVAGIQVLQTVQEVAAPPDAGPAELLPSFNTAFLVGALVALVGVVGSFLMRSYHRAAPIRPAAGGLAEDVEALPSRWSGGRDA